MRVLPIPFGLLRKFSGSLTNTLGKTVHRVYVYIALYYNLKIKMRSTLYITILNLRKHMSVNGFYRGIDQAESGDQGHP